MFSLVYRSEAKPELDLKQIEEILCRARDFNRSHNITGCILYHGGTFLQYIEGPHCEVIRLFDRINEDSRHENVKLLAHCSIDKRDFRRWDQAYENVFGANAMLNYLKLIVSESVDRESCPLPGNKAAVLFWSQARQILHQKPV